MPAPLPPTPPDPKKRKPCPACGQDAPVPKAPEKTRYDSGTTDGDLHFG